MIANLLRTPRGLWWFGHSPGVGSIDVKHVTCTIYFVLGGLKHIHVCFILWYATQFCLFAIQDFDSRLILYLNRPVIVFNVKCKCGGATASLRITIFMSYPRWYFRWCYSFSRRLFYSQIQSYILQSDTFPSIMYLIVHASLYNSSDVWMICLWQTIP